MHDRALPWLERAKASQIVLHVAAHSVAEFYSVLTTLPLRPKISPVTATRLIDSIRSIATIVPLTASDYRSTIDDLAKHGLSGGIVYDALIATAAKKAKVDQLVTLNPDHFCRVWPAGAKTVIVP
jgi:predicted nucleic acid-binding protein